MRRRMAAAIVTVVLAACAPVGVSTPSPTSTTTSTTSATPSPPPTRSPSPSAPASAEAEPSPTPARPLALTPLPQHVETTVAGIRIRVEPRLDAETIGTLPLGGTALAVLGPLVVDQYSWYQVRDNSGDPPEYGEGWMAVGTASDPWVTESLGWSGHPTYPYHIDGMASGEYGPFVVADWNHGLWWAAAGDSCSFAGDLVNAAGESAPFAEHADVTNFASGQVDSTFFLERPEFVGNVTVRVDSVCSWSVAVIRFQG